MNIIKTYKATSSPIKRKAIAEQAYLLYLNDYLTIDKFSEHHECTKEEAASIISDGKHWYNLPKIEAIEV